MSSSSSGVTFECYDEGTIYTDEKGIVTFDGGTRAFFIMSGPKMSGSRRPRRSLVRPPR